MNAIYKEGDIVVARWSYSMEWPEFYRVVSVSPKSVVIVELKRKLVRGDGFQGYEVPTDEPKGKPARHRINPDGSIRIGSRGSALGDAKMWDGKPQYADYLD